MSETPTNSPEIPASFLNVEQFFQSVAERQRRVPRTNEVFRKTVLDFGHSASLSRMTELAETLEIELASAQAEVQRLRQAILKILPGMKAQRPPVPGSWHWPHAVKVLEEALAGKSA